jgi:hypothetical protein
MNLNPNINLSDKQFLALQERAIRQDTSVELMIQKEVHRMAIQEMHRDSSPNGREQNV